MFIENFQSFINNYGEGRRLKIVGFFFLSLIAGLLEFVGIALIYPFVLLIVQPESIIHSKYYLRFSSFVHVENILINAFIFGFLVVILFLFKNLFMVATLYLQNKFSNNWKMDLNKRFMEYYIFSPYKNSLKSPPSEKIYNLTFLTSQVLDGFILRGINLLTNSVIVAMILILLFCKFPLAAIITSIFITCSMSIQSRFFKNKMREISKRLLSTSRKNNNKIIECITNLKELKILSAEKYFYNQYVKNQKDVTELAFESNLYSSMPPYIIELLIVFALLILAGIISVQNLQNTSAMVASYAIVVAAIFRIAPALNRIQASINSINSSRDFVKALNAEAQKNNFKYTPEELGEGIIFHETLLLKNIHFSYTENEEVIKDLTLEIKKGDFVGVIGLSGAGKSTLADIIMGLLPIDSGEILVDGIRLNEKRSRALRSLIGYVPQQINILDASFKENVAWGVEPDKIDENKVVKALEDAQLLEFVQSKGGVESNIIIGSSGLSQGQKQRLAIARALYRDSEILIFDEATSSLDVETENAITQMLNGLKGQKTIIAIAHRLSTLKSCNSLVYLKDGKVVDVGTFKELSSRHADFDKLIKLSMIDNA